MPPKGWATAISSEGQPQNTTVRFAKIPDSVIRDLRIGAGAFYVFAYLIMYVDHSAQQDWLPCRPYKDKDPFNAKIIAQALGMTRSTVMRHLKHLKEIERLRVENNYRFDGGKAPSRYWVSLNKPVDATPHVRQMDMGSHPLNVGNQTQPAFLPPLNGPMSIDRTTPCPPSAQPMSGKSDIYKESIESRHIISDPPTPRGGSRGALGGLSA